jgi:predicted RNase H-like HicB family nuclease
MAVAAAPPNRRWSAQTRKNWTLTPLPVGVQMVSSFQEKGWAMKYKIVLQKSEEGYSVSCPGLPGCWSQGVTEAEAMENIQDAIREYLAAVEDILQETPGAEVREVDVVCNHAEASCGSTISKRSGRLRRRVSALSGRENIL